ncbi:hypothetical protein BH20ACI2_BH20ACI2_24340 [soil metagenome]
MTVDDILNRLERLGSPENVAGMARFGIVTKKVFGVSAPEVKKIAREIGKVLLNHLAVKTAIGLSEMNSRSA